MVGRVIIVAKLREQMLEEILKIIRGYYQQKILLEIQLLIKNLI